MLTRTFGCFLSFCLFAGLSYGQQSTGEITGTVTDSTGAVVAGAKVTLNNPATDTNRSTVTNSSGIYDLPSLVPGTYNLKVEMSGFSTQARNEIDLQVAQVARLDFT